jgi:hypothetical protein
MKKISFRPSRLAEGSIWLEKGEPLIVRMLLQGWRKR